MDNLDRTVESQRCFFAQSKTKPLEFRREQLVRLRRLITSNEELICEAVYKDLKRDFGLTKQLELAPCVAEIDYTLANLESWAKPEYVEKCMANVLDTPYIVKEPYGNVLLITTWNFPALMYFFPLVPILAAGNTVMIKGSELSEETANCVIRLLTQTFDPAYLAAVSGGPEVCTKLLAHNFGKIMYTGNVAVGRIVMEAAAKHLTPCLLELGGKCPAVVLNDAATEIAAKRIAWAKFINVGQVCITVDYVIATNDIVDKLVDELKKVLKQFYGQDPQKSKDYSRIINQRHFDRLHSLLNSTEGVIQTNYGQADRDDLYIPPTIVRCGPNDSLMQEEIFGPILPILSVKSYEDALAYIKSRPAPLAAYIFSKKDKMVDKFVAEIECGAVVSNDLLVHYFVDTLPFGGSGPSGMGVYRGKFGFDEFSHRKAVMKKGYVGESLAS